MQNNANEMAVFNTAIYVRLSKEDIVAAQSGRESNSITNQKQLILDFLKDKPEFNIVSIRIDDGYTGTNFDRPAFQRMLNDIMAGRINCVVVKDLSRFGREYINSGKYIHRLFPVLGVRLIAINDNIDTITRDESSEFSITLKNLMNDNYSRDISVKVRSQLQVKRKHGDFICPFAPYGYQKCEGNHNRIEPDPYAATVVQDIFNWKIQGMTNNGIAIRLAESGILAPLEYKRHKGEPLFSGFKMKERCEWTAQAVARILTNPIYIGTLRQGLRRRPNYKIKKSIPTEENEWVVIHDTHEPVVTKRTFYLAQKALLIDTRAAPRATTVYPLSGLLECGECGNAVTRSTINNGYKLYSYFRCSVRTKEDRCELKQVPEAQVEAAVLQLWIIVPGTHEAIISEELFRAAQNALQGRIRNVNKNTAGNRANNLFVCGCCGRKLRKNPAKEPHLVCPKNDSIKGAECAGLFVNQAQIEQAVLQMLREQSRIFLEQHCLMQACIDKKLSSIQTELDANTNMTRRLQSRKAELYEQYRAGRISREKFADIQKKDSEKLARLSSRAEEIKRLLVEQYESRGNLAAGKRTADQIILLKDYDPEIIRNFVERVRVYPSGEIEIDMRTSSGFEFVTAS